MRPHISIGSIYYWIVVGLLFMPLMMIVVLSFNDSTSLGFPLEGFTLRWYDGVLHDSVMMAALRNSLLLSSISAAVATLLGSMLAMAIVRYKFPGRSALVAVAGAPLVIPYVILAVALLVMLNWVGMPLSLPTVALGQIVVSMPLALLIVTAGLVGFDRSLEEASMDLGASYFMTLVMVTLPIILPSLAAAFFTCLTVAFNEFAITFFLVGTEPVLPTYLYGQMRNITAGPFIMAAASVIVFGSIAVVILAVVLQGIGARRNRLKKSA